MDGPAGCGRITSHEWVLARGELYVAAQMIYFAGESAAAGAVEGGAYQAATAGALGGRTRGRAFVWVHLNRMIRKYDLNVMYVAGPGHGAPATIANGYLEGYYSEIYPDRGRNEVGAAAVIFRCFSFPGALGSHCTPEDAGFRFMRGGELGYSLSHGFWGSV